MPGALYYAEAFSPLPGAASGWSPIGLEPGRPTARAGELARVVVAPNGRRYRIEACEGHRPAAVEGSDSPV